MTLAGANGDTESQMASALQLDLALADVHPAMNALGQALQATVRGTQVRYDTLNSIWLANDHETADPFLDVLSQHYDTGVYLVDFAADADGARDSINQWVDERTDGLIPELFAPGQIAVDTELALTNASYLSAPWRDRFDIEVTSPGEFALPDGDVVEVSFMNRQWEYPFVLDLDWRAFELPFHGADMGMVFVLPNEGEYDELEANFDAALAEDVVAGLEVWRDDPQIVWIGVPRFDFSSAIDLQPALRALGMVSAFEEGDADFTRIDPAGDLFVGSFVHQTTVGVDENGTTAAAATGEILVPMPITPRIWLDRPFLFFVYDHGTGSVLFTGRFVRPAGEARAPAEPPEQRTDAEIICSNLVECADRTTTEAECVTSLEADDPIVLEACADCVQLGVDQCGGYPGCENFIGNVCQPATCAAYCPAHSF